MKGILSKMIMLGTILALIISLSLIGCKPAAVEEAVEEVEEAVEEAVEEVEEAVEEAVDQPFAGTTLRVGNTASLPIFVKWHEYFDPAYEEYSGVDVVTDLPPFSDFYAKLLTMVNAGGKDWDVMWIDGPWYGAFSALDALEPLNDYIVNAPPEELALEDFPIRSLGYLGMDGVHTDEIYAIPILHNVGVLSYRTDLFSDPDYMTEFKEKYGRDLAPPTTWEEYLETAQFFTRDTDGDGEIDLWGCNHRYGESNNFVGDLLIGFAYARGATLFDTAYEPLMSSPEMIEAVSFFTDPEFIAAQPPGVESFIFDDVINSMMQGKVAMYVTENMMVATLTDPELSPQAANIGFTEVPGWLNPDTGKIQKGTLAGAGGFAINANGDNKDAAWDYIQFMIGKSNSDKYIELGKSAIRISQYEDPDLLETYPWFELNGKQVTVSIGRPQNAWWGEAQFIMGKYGVEIMTAGVSVEDAMATADAELKQLLTDYKVYEQGDRYYTADERDQQLLDLLADLGIPAPKW